MPFLHLFAKGTQVLNAGLPYYLEDLSSDSPYLQAVTLNRPIPVPIYPSVASVTLKVKVKSACEPSGPSGWSLSWFLEHEATRSISTPPWMGF